MGGDKSNKLFHQVGTQTRALLRFTCKGRNHYAIQWQIIHMDFSGIKHNNQICLRIKFDLFELACLGDAGQDPGEGPTGLTDSERIHLPNK